MTITSKYKKSLSWVEVEVVEWNSRVTTDINSISEAAKLIYELNSVIQDLEQYIEDKTPKTEQQ